jgi:hypothetical protein
MLQRAASTPIRARAAVRALASILFTGRAFLPTIARTTGRTPPFLARIADVSRSSPQRINVPAKGRYRRQTRTETALSTPTKTECQYPGAGRQRCGWSRRRGPARDPSRKPIFRLAHVLGSAVSDWRERYGRSAQVLLRPVNFIITRYPTTPIHCPRAPPSPARLAFRQAEHVAGQR